MSYTVAYYIEVRRDSAGNGREKADEARENIPDRKQDVPLKWFRISGLRPVFPQSAHCVCVCVCRSWCDCFENVAGLYGRCGAVCLCVCRGVFNHDLSRFKAAEYLFSWSEAGVPPVLTFTVFHTWLTVWLWTPWGCIQNMVSTAFTVSSKYTENTEHMLTPEMTGD